MVLLLRNLPPSTSRASPAPCLSQGLRWPRSPPHRTAPLAPTSLLLALGFCGQGKRHRHRRIALDPGMIPDSAETLEGTQSQGLL